MTLGLGMTLAAIAVGHAVMRVPTKLDGWMDAESKGVTVEKRERMAEAECLFPSPVALPTQSTDYSLSKGVMSRAGSLQAEVESYRALPGGWDGEGSSGPSDEAIDGAKKLIEQLPAGVILPKAMISSSGELGFYWKSDTFFADITIESANTFSLFVRSRLNSDREFFFETLPIDESGAATIKDTLQQT